MNTEQRTTNNELRTRKAFTLLELVVSVALLAIVFSFATVIFKVSINSYRTAVANAEIMQKLRAITDQLNADFKGIRTDAPLLIWFQEDVGLTDSNRYDQIMFFADGDFQSTQLYDSTGVPAPDGDTLVKGNVARIYYGQAQNPGIQDPPNMADEDRLLARRQHILTADTTLDNWPQLNMSDFDDGIDANRPNEWYEHDSLSLAQWKIVQGDAYRDEIIPACFYSRPYINIDEPNTFHKLVCQGVGSFAIQWAYWNPDLSPEDDELRWYPSDDPDGDGNPNDSHFDLICQVCDEKFGVYFNIPNGSQFGRWYPIGDSDVQYRSGDYFPAGFYPEAIKFTFRLYDSKGIIKGGRTFTHIVYLGN